MCDCSAVSWWLAAWRALHFLACMLPVGLLSYHLLVARPVLRENATLSRATRASVFISLLIALLSGVAWLLLVAANVGDVTAGNALRGGVVTAVLNQTHFGRLWRLRALLWLGATVVSVFSLLRKSTSSIVSWLNLVTAGALLGSLAWAGHGLDGNEAAGRFHVIADMIHLLASGVWPFTLGPFAVALVTFRRTTDPRQWHLASALTRRFSAVALSCVTLLTLTGVANCVFMLPTVSSLWNSGYGRLLSLKIGVFAIMIVFAGINRFRLRPRLSVGVDGKTTLQQLHRNIVFELILGAGIILIVALLGLLAPPMP